MRTLLIALGLAAGLTTGLAGTARAGDFCVTVTPGGDATRYVAKSFKVPGKGKCKPWNGMFLPTFAEVSISTGTACTSSDGTTLRIHVVSMRASVAFNDYIVLPLPSLTDGTLDEIVPQFGGPPLHITGVSAGKCPTEAIP